MKEKRIAKNRKKRIIKRIIAIMLVCVFTVFPWLSFPQGNSFAQEGRLYIEMKKKGNMLNGQSFLFFGKLSRTGIYYWMKQDGSPLLCIQKNASLIGHLGAEESPEEFGEGTYFNKKQYELVSLVLQCCGMYHTETAELEPGAYLAAQAAVWGILSGNWEGTEQLQREMENVYQYVADWNDVTAEELIEQARDMTDRICDAIVSYYGDSSPYIPEFASKYQEKAPVLQAEWQEDGSCQVIGCLGEKSEAIKEFVFEMPEGWTYEWQDDQVIFRCEEAEEGSFLITGRAPENSDLREAMPIGLIYITYPADYPSLQHLASGVEITVPWCCYLRIVAAPPEKPGSWFLPEVRHYRHQEDFFALYGVELEKQDGDTGQPLPEVRFQPLEYFDDHQLEGLTLEKEQFASWNGWKARCGEEITDSKGCLAHWDCKEYHYEKTYCSGHPDPVIQYEGNSEEKREQLTQEAWEAWELAVEECGEICDYHAVDKSAREQLQEDRDLAYDQFIHLVYGYTFEETKAAEGYELPREQEARLERVFCTSVQAGGSWWKESMIPERSEKQTERVTAGASKSNAGKKVSVDAEEAETASRSSASNAGRNLAKSRSGTGRSSEPLWLTSLVLPIVQETAEKPVFYLFQAENFKKEIPADPESTPSEPPEASPSEPPSTSSGNPTVPSWNSKDHADGEGLPSLAETERPDVRTGWIRAVYASPSSAGQKLTSSSSGRNKEEAESRSLPKTGDPGMRTVCLMLLTAGSGTGLALEIRRRRKKPAYFKKTHILWLLLLFIFICKAFPCFAAAPETSMSGEDMTDDPIAVLSQIERTFPERTETVQQTVHYAELEDPCQIPESIFYETEEEETGRRGNGNLSLLGACRGNPHWIGEFQFPVVFYNYGADQYEFQGTCLPADTVLEELLNRQELLLESVDCSPEKYRIDGIVWDGECYAAAPELWCRNALAFGTKLVADYTAVYEGTICYPELTRTEWETVPLATLPQTEERGFYEETEEKPVPSPVPELETETLPESETEPPEEPAGQSLTRLFLAYTISAVILLPVLIYLVWMLKKKRN